MRKIIAHFKPAANRVVETHIEGEPFIFQVDEHGNVGEGIECDEDHAFVTEAEGQDGPGLLEELRGELDGHRFE